MFANGPREIVGCLDGGVPARIWAVLRIGRPREVADTDDRDTPELGSVQHDGNAELLHVVPVRIAGVEVAVDRFQPAHAQLEFIQFGGADHKSVPQHALMGDGAVHRTHAGEDGAAPRRVAGFGAVAVTELKARLCVGLPVDSRQFRVVVDFDEFRIVHVIVGEYIVERTCRRSVGRWKEPCGDDGLRRNPARGDDVSGEGRLRCNSRSSGVQDPLCRIVNDGAIRREVAGEVRRQWHGTIGEILLVLPLALVIEQEE